MRDYSKNNKLSRLPKEQEVSGEEETQGSPLSQLRYQAYQLLPREREGQAWEKSKARETIKRGKTPYTEGYDPNAGEH